MKKMDAGEMMKVNGGAKCPNCGRKVSTNAFAVAWHWLTKGCWGYSPR